MIKYDVLNNDFEIIGEVQASNAIEALQKAKSNSKIKSQCVTPIIGEKPPVIQLTPIWRRQ